MHNLDASCYLRFLCTPEIWCSEVECLHREEVLCMFLFLALEKKERLQISMSRFLIAMDRHCIPVDTIVSVHATMAVAGVFSDCGFAMAFKIMFVECTQLPYKLLYPRGYNYS